MSHEQEKNMVISNLILLFLREVCQTPLVMTLCFVYGNKVGNLRCYTQVCCFSRLTKELIGIAFTGNSVVIISNVYCYRTKNIFRKGFMHNFL